jgi:hypothetical protein
MFNEKHRYSTFALFLSLILLMEMILPAGGHGNALMLQPATRLTIHEAVLSEPLSPGTYDDIDSHLSYSGNWEVQTGVTGVSNGTLHVSNFLGDKVEFQFIGNELRIFFLTGPSQGSIRFTLDNDSYVIDEANSNIVYYEWVIAASNNYTHNVTITHEGGGPVNLDRVIVPAAPCTPNLGPQIFVDVPASHPYSQDIEILYAKGLTAGCSSNPLKYCPDQTMSPSASRRFHAAYQLRPGLCPELSCAYLHG